MIASGEIAATMSPLEDLYLTRTDRDRNGTIPDRWNNVLLIRDFWIASSAKESSNA
jgi:hypothetical protein